MSDEAGEATAAFAAFAGQRRIAAGSLADAALAAKRALEHDGFAAVLVFDTTTGEVRDLDLRGTEADVAARYALRDPTTSRRGRPKLGVVAREVTLLPRHWEWLASQPGGASVALRKVVEAARKADDPGQLRLRVDAAYRFMSVMAGDLPAFEEASRALFAGDRERLRECMRGWPNDVGAQVWRYLDAEPGVA